MRFLKSAHLSWLLKVRKVAFPSHTKKLFSRFHSGTTVIHLRHILAALCNVVFQVSLPEWKPKDYFFRNYSGKSFDLLHCQYIYFFEPIFIQTGISIAYHVNYRHTTLLAKENKYVPGEQVNKSQPGRIVTFPGARRRGVSPLPEILYTLLVSVCHDLHLPVRVLPPLAFLLQRLVQMGDPLLLVFHALLQLCHYRVQLQKKINTSQLEML